MKGDQEGSTSLGKIKRAVGGGASLSHMWDEFLTWPELDSIYEKILCELIEQNTIFACNYV